MTHFDLVVIEKRNFEICLLKTMENFTRESQRYYIWVCWKNGKGADDIHKELVIAEGTKALSKRTIYRWIEAFEAGQSSVEDAPRSGRPREAVTPLNVNIVEDLISNDPHISIENIQEVIPISTGSIETILHNELSVKKVCAKWIPHFLMRISERELRFPDSFSSILTMAFKILLLGMNHGLISSQFHLRMTIKFGSVEKKTVPKSQERQKIVKNGCFAFSSQ